MYTKFKKWFYKVKSNQEKILKSTHENEWAHIYHDSIRGKLWLENLPLNVGRWAGNYTFFYLLNRILNDFEPKNILEFGLGESTKFITSYIDNYLVNTNHLVIEHDENWKKQFLKKNKINENTSVEIAFLEKQLIKTYEVNTYNDIEKKVGSKFELYIIDGPFGSPRFSRYDIVTLAQNFDKKDEFIIIMDDYHRKGEQDTVNDLMSKFKDRNIDVTLGVYTGSKSVAILATKKYKYATTL